MEVSLSTPIEHLSKQSYFSLPESGLTDDLALLDPAIDPAGFVPGFPASKAFQKPLW